MRFVYWMRIVLMLMSASIVSAQGLEVTPSSINLGTLLQHQKSEDSFEIRNGGDKVITITKVKSNCGCTTALPQKRQLAPGESTRLNVTFDAGFFMGKQEKQVYVETNEPHRYTLFVYADVVKPYSVEPSRVVIKDGSGIVEQVLRLRSNVDDERITVDRVSSQDACVRAEVGSWHTIRLLVDTDGTCPENSSVDIWLQEMKDPLTVPIRIERDVLFQVVPRVLTLMGIREGSRTRRSIRISGDVENIRLESWDTDVPFIQVEGLESSRTGADLTVVTVPDKMKPGFGKGTLHVDLKYGEAKQETLDIPVAFNIFASITENNGGR